MRLTYLFMFELELSPGFAVCDDKRCVKVFRLRDGAMLRDWRLGDLELRDSATSIYDFALDKLHPRIAVLFKNNIHLLDLSSEVATEIIGVVARCESLVAIGPDGRLFTQSESMGLASIYAFESMDDVDVASPGNSSPFHPQLGELCFALGFNCLPHVEALAFSPNRRFAVSRSMSQYRSHLAYVNVRGAGALLHAEAREVVRFSVRPGFADLIVQESSFNGSKRISLWTIEAGERIVWQRDVYVESDDSRAQIQDYVMEPDGKRVVIVMNSGQVAIVNIDSGVVNHFSRVVTPRKSASGGTMAIDFANNVMAICGSKHLTLLDLSSGNLVGQLQSVDAVYTKRGRFFAITKDRVDVINELDFEQVAGIESPIVAAAVGDPGLVIVDAKERVICIE
jgi:hypothetical protein